MSQYEHSAALGWAMEAEGSLESLIYNYGISMESLPDDLPPHIRGFFRSILIGMPQFEEIRKYLEGAVEEFELRDDGATELDAYR